MRRVIHLAILLCSAIVPDFAQKYTVETVPNQKLIDGSYVSNPDRILSDEAVAEINQKLSELESQTTVQIAVVVINSIGEADLFDFAQDLFNSWGIGNAEKDNGLLILMVMDQRTVRFHTGYGLEGVLPDVVCKRIQMEYMIPSFRDGEFEKGLLAGIDRTITILSNPEYQEELRAEEHIFNSGWDWFIILASILGVFFPGISFLILYTNEGFSNSKIKKKTTKKAGKKKLYPELKMNSWSWFFLYMVIPLGGLYFFNSIILDIEYPIPTYLLFLYGVFLISLIYKRMKLKGVSDRLLNEKQYYEAVELYQDRQVYWLVMGILFPLPFLFLFFQFLSRKKFFRNHPRDCKNCNNPLVKLGEKDDDLHLEKKQIFEEELGSVDYDVWLCNNCQSNEVLRYVNRFSKYKACPSCKTQALYTASRRTIESATYESSGKGEQTDKCKFCNHVKISYYTIPKKTRSSSGSGGGGGGGSWGGGSSGGGGSSSSW